MGVKRRGVNTYLVKGSLQNPLSGPYKDRAQKCENIEFLSQAQTKGLQMLMLLPKLHNLPDELSGPSANKWREWVHSSEGFAPLPPGWDGKLKGKSPRNTMVYACLIVKALAPGLLPAYLVEFVASVMGKPFLEVPPFDLETQMNMISKGSTPLMMVSAPGFDPSGQVTALAGAKKKQTVSMAMGSKEGFAQADKMISAGAKQGQWVILKNVHLAIEWLKVLEKKLSSIQVGSPDNYRLFLCMEMNPKVGAFGYNQLRQEGQLAFFEGEVCWKNIQDLSPQNFA